MKPHRFLNLLAATLLFAALPMPSPAAEVGVDISSFAPRNGDVILRQIKLNVALKQYEKVLTEIEENRLRIPVERAGIEIQGKVEEAHARLEILERRTQTLEIRAESLQEQVRSLIDAAKKEAEKQKAAQGETKTEHSELLQGRWEGRLGKPLGTRIVLAGASPEKPPLLDNPLEVSEMDGKHLPSPFVIEIRGKAQIRPGITYRLEGYEAGEFSGDPTWFNPAVQQPFQYRVFFVVTKVIEPASK